MDTTDVERILEQLVEVTNTSATGTSLFPRDLDATNDILEASIDILIEDLASGNQVHLSMVTSAVLHVMCNVQIIRTTLDRIMSNVIMLVICNIMVNYFFYRGLLK